MTKQIVRIRHQLVKSERLRKLIDNKIQINELPNLKTSKVQGSQLVEGKHYKKRIRRFTLKIKKN